MYMKIQYIQVRYFRYDIKYIKVFSWSFIGLNSNSMNLEDNFSINKSRLLIQTS